RLLGQVTRAFHAISKPLQAKNVEGVESFTRALDCSRSRRNATPAAPLPPPSVCISEGKMNLRVFSNSHVHVVTSFREFSPYAILGLGGVLTIAWIVLLSWIPVRLMTSAISIAIGELNSI